MLESGGPCRISPDSSAPRRSGEWSDAGPDDRRPALFTARNALVKRLCTVFHRDWRRDLRRNWAECMHIDDAETPSCSLDHRSDVDAASAANQEIRGSPGKAICVQGWALHHEFEARMRVRRSRSGMRSAETALTGANAPGTGIVHRVIAKAYGPAMA